MEKELSVLQELYLFHEKISVDGLALDSSFLSDVVAKDPRIAVYLASISFSSITNGLQMCLTLNVQYKNKEIPLQDIHVVSTEQEMHGLLCQSVGNYKKYLILLSKPSLNIEMSYKHFLVSDAPFYANFVGTQLYKSVTSLTPFVIFRLDLKYRIGRVKLCTMENEVEQEVKRLARQMFLSDMPEEAKVYLAHNYLASTIQYTLKSDASNLEKSYIQSAYGALIKKQCVCQGFAEAFKRLMDAADVDCDVVCGQILASSERHAWNIVKLKSGKNYHIDVTWDSNHAMLIYDFFAKDDSFFAKSRVWNRQYSPQCLGGADLWRNAKMYVRLNKSALLSKGVLLTTLDL